jgi:hypothetical protein
MSKVNETRTYALDAKATADALAAAGEAGGLKLKSRTADVIEMTGGLSLFSWPPKLTAKLTPSGDRTAVHYQVSNFGFGPIQTSAVRNVLAKVTTALASSEAK